MIYIKYLLIYIILVIMFRFLINVLFIFLDRIKDIRRIKMKLFIIEMFYVLEFEVGEFIF